MGLDTPRHELDSGQPKSDLRRLLFKEAKGRIQELKGADVYTVDDIEASTSRINDQLPHTKIGPIVEVVSGLFICIIDEWAEKTIMLSEDRYLDNDHPPYQH